MKALFSLLALIMALSSSGSLAADKPLPRVLVSLYDSTWESSPRPSQVHRFLEMPANYLGYDVHYLDISKPLPKLGDDVAGIIVWFDIGTEVPDPDAYLSWLEEAEAAGKKIIIIENGGFGDRYHANPRLMQRWNNVLSALGMQDDGEWNQLTYHASVLSMDKTMIGFERKVEPPLPALTGTHIVSGSGAKSHLEVKLPQGDGDEEIFDLVITGPGGGYIAPGYALYEEDRTRPGEDQWTSEPYFLWYVNPFLFLARALDVHVAPIPDVTTLDGRRIFYSHIDGDGWNNVSEADAYRGHTTISARVIYNEILKPYSDLAFNVGVIAADIDPDCYGVEDSIPAAREIFALPNVEPSSHTYSHPLFWEFFANYDPEQEKPYLSRYPMRPKDKFSLERSLWNSISSDVKDEMSSPDSTRGTKRSALKSNVKRGRNEESVESIMKKYYDTPRSYACSPFNLEQEIVGSTAQINALSPADKKVRLLQWSGDTSPFEAALAMTHKAHLLNINGGDSRFDKEYPSYSYVAPIGLQVGNERQIYSSNSNEDTYTNLWTERFYGYRYLRNTVKNTESPIRVSPFNVYFHIFSGEKQASLNAVKENLDFARRQEIIPITASDYASIAEGFYSTSIQPAGALRWLIHNRGDLETLRFNNVPDMEVDLAHSTGILGERYHENSLYVALDPATQEAVVALRKNPTAGVLPADSMPYLVESRWQIRNLQRGTDTWQFEAGGYGPGIMLWKVPAEKTYRLQVSTRQGKVLASKQVGTRGDSLLYFSLGTNGSPEPLIITIHAI